MSGVKRPAFYFLRPNAGTELSYFTCILHVMCLVWHDDNKDLYCTALVIAVTGTETLAKLRLPVNMPVDGLTATRLLR